jgi:ATP-dependent Lon protease
LILLEITSHSELFSSHKTLEQLTDVLEAIKDMVSETDGEEDESGNVDSEEDEYIIKHGLKRVQADLKTHRKTKAAKRAGTITINEEKNDNTISNAITKFLNRFFGMYLVPYEYIVLHELIYFVDPASLLPKVWCYNLGFSCRTTRHDIHCFGSTPYIFTM